MSLANTIHSYVVSKKHTDRVDNPHDKIKQTFFAKVEAARRNGSLSAVWLVNQIHNMRATDRNNLFYKGRSGEARTNSKAAKLVFQLLDEYGLFLNDDHKQHLISGRLTSRDVLSSYVKVFVEAPFQLFRLENMQRELRSYLSLSSIMTVNERRELLLGLFTQSLSSAEAAGTLMIEVTKSVFQQMRLLAEWHQAVSDIVIGTLNRIETDGGSSSASALAILLADKDIATVAYANAAPEKKPHLLRYIPSDVKAILPAFEYIVAESPQAQGADESKDASTPPSRARSLPSALNRAEFKQTTSVGSVEAASARQLGMEAKKYIEREYAINGDSEKAPFLKELCDNFERGRLLTVEYLNQCISRGFERRSGEWYSTPRETLFRKRIGYRSSCKTAKIVFHLYEMALGRPLLKHEKNAIVYDGHNDKLPQGAQLMSVEQRQQECAQAEVHRHQTEAMQAKMLEAAWQRIDVLTQAADERGVDVHADEIDESKDTHAANAPSPSLVDEGQRRLASREMVQAANKEALGGIRFDSNGHALMEVVVDNKLQHVSVDIIRAVKFEAGTELAGIEKRYVRWLDPGLSLTPKTFNELPPYMQALFRSESRGSINNMQLEIEGHIRLCARTFEKKYAKQLESYLAADENYIGDKQAELIRRMGIFSKEVMEPAIQQALLAMNSVVAAEVKQILSSSTFVKSGEIHLDMSLVESKLDQAFARSKKSSVHDRCIHHLITAMRKKYGNENEHKSTYEARIQLFYQAVLAAEDKDFESTTATDHAYLHTDNRNKTVCWVQGTAYSSHDKQIGGEHVALQLMRRGQLRTEEKSGVSEVESLATSRVEARVPSLAVYKAKESTRIDDVRNKLVYIDGQMSRQDITVTQVEGDEHEQKVSHVRSEYNSTGPTVYNALTSLHTRFKDNLPKWLGGDRGNYQRRSIDSIMMGAHKFNRAKVTGSPANYHGLFLVQNVPVNQHTSNLDLDAFDDATGEASLMVEVAMLATLQQQAHLLPQVQRKQVNTLHKVAQDLYVDFLKNVPVNTSGKAYFHRSKQGRLLRNKIKAYNQVRNEQAGYFDDVVAAAPEDPLETLAAKALYHIHAFGLHRDKVNGMTVQALSIFLQPKSLYGCKSANERFQAVANRVELLHGLAARDTQDLDTLPAEQREFRKMLAGFCKGTNTMTQLQVAMNKAYNASTLSGSAAAVSIHDQAARSKVTKSSWGTVSRVGAFHTNKAEPKSVSYLYASSAAKCQTGKGHFAKTSHQVLRSLLADADTATTESDSSVSRYKPPAFVSAP
ncbi:MAG: hypothetical protein P1U63_05065 [Coxiellaceae bacterium]|nr:hypothetical protein [Coxiellaceae bacterium]